MIDTCKNNCYVLVQVCELLSLWQLVQRMLSVKKAASYHIYNATQLYCHHGEIPLAAIGTQQNVKHHMNMIYLRLFFSLNACSKRACQD